MATAANSASVSLVWPAIRSPAIMSRMELVMATPGTIFINTLMTTLSIWMASPSRTAARERAAVTAPPSRLTKKAVDREALHAGTDDLQQGPHGRRAEGVLPRSPKQEGEAEGHQAVGQHLDREGIGLSGVCLVHPAADGLQGWPAGTDLPAEAV